MARSIKYTYPRASSSHTYTLDSNQSLCRSINIKSRIKERERDNLGSHFQNLDERMSRQGESSVSIIDSSPRYSHTTDVLSRIVCVGPYLRTYLYQLPSVYTWRRRKEDQKFFMGEELVLFPTGKGKLPIYFIETHEFNEPRICNADPE